MTTPRKNLLIFDHAAYLPGGNWPQRHYELARHLQRSGVSTTLVGSGFDHRSRRSIMFKWYQLWRSQEVDGIRYVWLRLPAYAHLRMRIFNMTLYPVLAVLCFASGYLKRPDCVIGSSPHIFSPIAARIASLLSGARFVFEIRDLWPDSVVDVLGVRKDSFAVRFMRWLERYLFKKADRVISVLPGISTYVRARNFQMKKPPVWIPNGANVDSIPVGGIKPTHNKVVYFGAVGPANALEKLLAVWQHVEAAVPDAQLEIIGDGPSTAELHFLKEDLKLKRVTFRGFMASKAELYAEAAHAAAFVMSVADRGIYKFGVGANKIAEYLALGRPLIYIGDGLADDLARLPFVLSFKPDVPDSSIGANIASFLREQALNQVQNAGAARDAARAQYSYDRLADRLFDVCFSPDARVQPVSIMSSKTEVGKGPGD